MIAIDFETYYDKDYSLRNMSTYNYIHDERFDAYLVALYSDDLQWVGHPSEFDWTKIKGATLLAHNASFDEMVLDHLRELGIVPADCIPGDMICTADMVAYLGCRRGLKTACHELLDIDISKAVRSNMQGKTYGDAKEEGMEEALIDYGLDDAKHCYMLAAQYLKDWPEEEQKLSKLNRAAGVYGLAIDRKAVDAGRTLLFDTLNKYEAQLPWMDGNTPDAKPLSPKYLRLTARKAGIPVPASLAKDDPLVVKWREQYGDKYPWVRATGEYRSVNSLLKRVENLRSNSRPDDTVPYQLKYWGAHTGRFSGGGDSGGKFNVQNMPRDTMYGVDLRGMFVPRPGHIFAIADYSQIEARALLWRVGDTAFLDLIKKEGNIYIAYAKHTQDKIIEKGTPEYQMAKMQVLLLGYYGGWRRFKDAAASQYGVDLTEAEAQAAVNQYRSSNPLIVSHWHDHQRWLKYSTNHTEDTHEVELASGRVLYYFQPRYQGQDVTALFERGGNRRRLHAGIITNNEIQATCRDILRDAWLALDKKGYRIVLNVHDELVLELPESEAPDMLDDIRHLMCDSSPWAEGCPIEVDIDLADKYCKG